MTKIIFIRHAETHWNTMNLLQGRRNLTLSVPGRYNASKWNLNQKYNTIWSSPLLRATQTAELVFKKNQLSIID